MSRRGLSLLFTQGQWSDVPSLLWLPMSECLWHKAKLALFLVRLVCCTPEASGLWIWSSHAARALAELVQVGGCQGLAAVLCIMSLCWCASHIGCGLHVHSSLLVVCTHMCIMVVGVGGATLVRFPTYSMCMHVCWPVQVSALWVALFLRQLLVQQLLLSMLCAYAHLLVCMVVSSAACGTGREQMLCLLGGGVS